MHHRPRRPQPPSILTVLAVAAMAGAAVVFGLPVLVHALAGWLS